MTRNSFPFWQDKNLSEEEKNEMLVETCRKVFGSGDGRIVLNMLMTDLHLLDAYHNAHEEVLNEYAKFFIRERLGVRDTKSITDFIAETAIAGGGR